MKNFGTFLKDLRISKGWTQAQLAAVLHVNENNFRDLDKVTVSRWETNKNIPSIERQIQIVRVLTNDLSDYLSEISDERQATKISSFFKKRFGSGAFGLNKDMYTKNIKIDDQILVSRISNQCEITDKRLVNFIENSNQFALDTGALTSKAFDKFLVIKHLNDNGELIGHVIGVHVALDLEVNVDSFKVKNVFDNAKKYSETGNYAFLVLSMYSDSQEVFESSNALFANYLVSRANIKNVYVRVKAKAVKSYLAALDSEPLFSIGEHSVYRFDSASWLSSPGVLKSLINR